MPAMPTRPRVLAGVALAGLVTTLFTGCFGNPVDGVKQGVEQALKSAGADVSFDGKLPGGFPKAVPLVAGQIVFSGGSDSGGWLVTIESKSADPAADAEQALVAAGFVKDTQMSNADAGASVYSNADYQVVVAVHASTVAYTVAKK